MQQFNFNSYYTVGSKNYLSKIEALAAANGNMNLISFHWMEDTWDNIDWTVEPTQSWLELLKLRCQQLRDNYDWVAIWYSSGYDSHTILRSFVDNNILVDEILIYDRREWFDDPEMEHAISHANYIKNTYYPNLKINLINVTLNDLIKFYKRKKEDWIYSPYFSLKIQKTHRYFATTEMDDFLMSFKNTIGKRANVMGIDKPKVLLRDNKWYAFVPDSVGDTAFGTDQENFYWSTELPELHIKQCHMVIRWFESLSNLTEDLVHDIQGRNLEKSKVYDLYYEPWNVGMGRFSLNHSHEYSRNGQIKMFHSNNERSPDGLKLLDHIKNNDNQVFKIYTQGLLQARQFGSDTLNKTIISKQYYIKDKSAF